MVRRAEPPKDMAENANFKRPKANRVAYFPQTCEPEVQTKGTVMPVQQVV
jgi:hypothetical protein